MTSFHGDLVMSLTICFGRNLKPGFALKQTHSTSAKACMKVPAPEHPTYSVKNVVKLALQEDAGLLGKSHWN